MSDGKGLAALAGKHRSHSQSVNEPKNVRAAHNMCAGLRSMEKYSTKDQSDSIREYAEKRNIEIVSTTLMKVRAGYLSMAGMPCT
jgi:hypothetical protein